MSKYIIIIRERIIYHWRQNKRILIILSIPVIAIALYFLTEGLISIGELIDVILITFLVASTIGYTKWTYKILRVNRKEASIRNLEMKLKNFYTPLYTSYYDIKPGSEDSLFKYLETKDKKQYYMIDDRKKELLRIIGDDLHFADDKLYEGLIKILGSNPQNRISRVTCDDTAKLIKKGFEKYKKEYKEKTSKDE